jgi:intracellular sulfur oxidation DsrE/DsrF family protein
MPRFFNILRVSFISLFLVQAASAAPPDDRVALKGLSAVKAVVDVRVPDQEKLLFNLKLVEETLAGMRQQKVRPTVVVTFRGPGVKFLTAEQADGEVRSLLAKLKGEGDGVRLEVCTVALRHFKADNSPLVPEVVAVGNVLTSQIAYQNRGYALITLN